MTTYKPRLLAIVELGGYPNFTPLYQRLGLTATFVNSQRKAQAYLKKQVPDLVVAEYNFQSDFRDRTSNLESLMAVLQRHPQVQVIVFYQVEQASKLELLRARFPVAAALPFPISPTALEETLRQAVGRLCG
jgi:DNA-binding NtrC family response regulator